MRYSFKELSKSDLVVDAIYEGGASNNKGSDPLSKLLGVMNSRGFRIKGSAVHNDIKYCVLKSTGDDIDWPDTLDPETGQFIYYGDQKKTGFELHNTKMKGNFILRQVFSNLHLDNRINISPFFVFTKEKGWNVKFRGLAVPGYPDLSSREDLTAIWKQVNGDRYQNYRAVFTILDEQVISRSWINHLASGGNQLDGAPEAFRLWVESGVYRPLKAPTIKKIRSKNDQLPTNKKDIEMIEQIYNFYSNSERSAYDFEMCAVEIVRLMDKNVISCDRTRPWRDGGRDAVGKYRIGSEVNGIEVDFAIEAKRYKNGVGIKETSRLVSRLRHRQFGVLVTTSYLSDQAYKEIIDDQHPIIVISAIDIVKILKDGGFDSKPKIMKWLQAIDTGSL